MNNQIKLSKKTPNLSGSVQLSGSKSISNRVLIIQALSRNSFTISGLASSKDTVTLKRLLGSSSDVLDTGAAGTTFRFMTSYLALTNYEGTLTGSERMKQRPIGELVQALNQLGACISYAEKEGFPPLQFHRHEGLSKTNEVELSADVSSQFITSLLLIAPSLPEGLTISLRGNLVSKPYLMMTLSLMQHFGVHYTWEGEQIKVLPQTYIGRDFVVEADWSAASYYYSLAAISNSCELALHGLQKDSLQGDQKIMDIMQALGVTSHFEKDALILRKDASKKQPVIEFDFIECPDLAQTVIAACAATGTKGIFTGLQTLYIKETDRVQAMANELHKINSLFYPVPEQYSRGDDIYYTVEGQARFGDQPIIFDTYEDHRMAMALAPLAVLHPIHINHPMVVEKSYPEFWEDLKRLGFEIGD